MISPRSTRFEYINRGYSNSIVLIPGWATDYRIFNSLDLKFNYLIPINFYPFGFGKSLLEILEQKNMAKVSLFGWSLGGFIAAEFASKYVNLVDNLILVSIRKKYDKEKLTAIKRLLKKDKRGYLYKFYTQCFANQEQMCWFRTNLLKTYCEGFDINYLLDTLDYLQDAQIHYSMFKSIDKLNIIHGEHDRIAPIEEAIEVKNKVRQVKFIPIENAGHMPFWKKDFNDFDG